MRLRPLWRRAYTLVEILLGVVVGGMLMVVILSLMRSAFRGGNQANEALESLQSAVMVSEILQRDAKYMTYPMANPPPPETNAAGPGGGTPGGAGPTTPSAPAPSPGGGTGAVDAGTGTITSGLVLEPFKEWDAQLGGPKTDDQTVFDMTSAQLEASGGVGTPPDESRGFRFFRTQVDGDSSTGLFSLSGNTAKINLQQVQFVARKSIRYAAQNLYVLERWVFPAEIPPVDATNPTALAKPTVDRGAGESRLYKNFYFKRLVLSMHRAPETGEAPGSSTGGGSAPAPAPGGGGSAAPPPPDQLYFLRIMVAGVSAGPGTRQVQDESGQLGKDRQPVDLLVNLVLLDGISDRFRRRSLASKWNPIVDSSGPP